MICNEKLTNIGNYCKVPIDEIKRIMFTAKSKEDGTENKILIADADTMANWQTLFDKFNFDTDGLTKVVPSPLVYGLTGEQADNVVDESDGYYVKLADGDYTITLQHIELNPYSIQQYKDLEDRTLCIYLVDADNRVWGIDDTTYLKPLEIQGFQVTNFKFGTREAAPKVTVKFRIKNPRDMNDLIYVEIADGKVTSDSDFYSLIDCTNTVTTPAVTGCIATIATTNKINGTAIAVTSIPYTAFEFVLSDTGAIETLAAAGSLTEAAGGVYTVNEAALLTTGKTYYLRISYDGYDIAEANVIVP